MATKTFEYQGRTIRAIQTGPAQMVVHDHEARVSATCGFDPEACEWVILHSHEDKHTPLGLAAESAARDVARAAAEILFQLRGKA